MLNPLLYCIIPIRIGKVYLKLEKKEAPQGAKIKNYYRALRRPQGTSPTPCSPHREAKTEMMDRNPL